MITVTGINIFRKACERLNRTITSKPIYEFAGIGTPTKQKTIKDIKSHSVFGDWLKSFDDILHKPFFMTQSEETSPKDSLPPVFREYIEEIEENTGRELTEDEIEVYRPLYEQAGAVGRQQYGDPEDD